MSTINTESVSARRTAGSLHGVVRRFRLHWKHGDVQEITTEHTGNRMEACADAMNEAGIGQGALRALDYWEEIAPNEKLRQDAPANPKS